MSGNHHRHKLSYSHVVMVIACVLFCLVLISTSLTSGLYARYVTRDSGYDSGRVIKFNQLVITEEGDFVDLENGNKQFVFIPGVPLEKKITINFGGSEAATIVFVEVNAPNWTVTNQKNYKAANEQLTWSVVDEWNYLEGQNGKYVYYQTLNPNDKLDSGFILGDEVAVSREGLITLYANYSETNFTVTAYAVQANGFDTVSDAWKSLKK